MSADPERYGGEPHRLELRADGLARPLAPGAPPRRLEVQVFMSSRGELAAMAARGGAVSCLAATWNVGNALPPPPAELAAQWLRGTAAGAEHHLVAVAAQECGYTRDAKAARAAERQQSARGAGTDAAAAAATVVSGEGADGNGGSAGGRDAPPTILASRSARTVQAAAAEAAREVSDTEADEDDEDDDDDVVEDDGGRNKGERQRAAGGGGKDPARQGAGAGGDQRRAVSRSLKGRIAQNFDSAQDWVRLAGGEGGGR